MKKRKIKKLLYFFIFPIIMIGYPSIQEVQIGNDWVSFKKYKAELMENPDNTEAREQLVVLTKKLESRANSTEASIEVTEAYILLEDPTKALEWANIAESSNPQDEITEEEKATNQKVLTDLKEFANLQKDLNDNKISLQDTVQIKKRLDRINPKHRKTQQYFNKKYLQNNKLSPH